jgi:hypothetical protein
MAEENVVERLDQPGTCQVPLDELAARQRLVV